MNRLSNIIVAHMGAGLKLGKRVWYIVGLRGRWAILENAKGEIHYVGQQWLVNKINEQEGMM